MDPGITQLHITRRHKGQENEPQRREEREDKTVERVLPIHVAQTITYLKLSGYRLGFLLNWNVKLMKNGIKRLANNL